MCASKNAEREGWAEAAGGGHPRSPTCQCAQPAKPRSSPRCFSSTTKTAGPGDSRFLCRVHPRCPTSYNHWGFTFMIREKPCSWGEGWRGQASEQVWGPDGPPLLGAGIRTPRARSWPRKELAHRGQGAGQLPAVGE